MVKRYSEEELFAMLQASHDTVRNLAKAVLCYRRWIARVGREFEGLKTPIAREFEEIKKV